MNCILRVDENFLVTRILTFINKTSKSAIFFFSVKTLFNRKLLAPLRVSKSWLIKLGTGITMKLIRMIMLTEPLSKLTILLLAKQKPRIRGTNSTFGRRRNYPGAFFFRRG